MRTQVWEAALRVHTIDARNNGQWTMAEGEKMSEEAKEIEMVRDRVGPVRQESVRAHPPFFHAHAF